MAILVDLVVFLASGVFLHLLLSLPLFGAFKKREHFSFRYGFYSTAATCNWEGLDLHLDQENSYPDPGF
jgi:hypothetical protein